MIKHDNDGKHIQTVIFHGTCEKHNADRGEPCFTSITGAEDIMVGVCNKRAKRAGFNGKISDDALRKKSPSGRGR